MQTRSDNDPSSLYVRWTPDGSPVAVELRLDLVARIREQMDQAGTPGIEIGGVLTGTHVNGSASTLRVDDVVMIPRRPEDGAVFMLDPREHDRFLTTRWDSKTKGRAPVGFFRTHLRPGPLRPSLADRTLLAGQFTGNAYVVLLITAKEPHLSALFLGFGGKLSEEPSVPEFLFSESEFNTLPEAESTPATVSRAPGAKPLFWILVTAVVIAIAIALVQNWSEVATLWPGGEHGVNLAVRGDRILDITWSHSATDIGKAMSAKLIIVDGTDNREIPIGIDELRLGTVEYQRSTDEVKVTLVLIMPGATLVQQSAAWHS